MIRVTWSICRSINFFFFILIYFMTKFLLYLKLFFCRPPKPGLLGQTRLLTNWTFSKYYFFFVFFSLGTILTFLSLFLFRNVPGTGNWAKVNFFLFMFRCFLLLGTILTFLFLFFPLGTILGRVIDEGKVFFLLCLCFFLLFLLLGTILTFLFFFFL